MYFTEQEIFSQYDALDRTFQQLLSQKEELLAFYRGLSCDSITFIGCGSSYSLAKSAALSARIHLGVPAYAVAGGDLYLNFDRYQSILKNTLAVSISRSGSTSEILYAIDRARKVLDFPCVSISARSDSEIGRRSQFKIELPWAFDESVCQTRCVTNLYCANLLMIALLAGKDSLVEEIRETIQRGNAYMQQYQPVLKAFAEKPFEQIFVLADGEMEGIAEEGALAFNEISMLPSRYLHVLDVRHGPMVLADEKTLVIVALSPDDQKEQNKLLNDFRAKGSMILTFGSCAREAVSETDCHIAVPQGAHISTYGIPFIFICQCLSFYKALLLGGNPDQPTGLDPWIQL